MTHLTKKELRERLDPVCDAFEAAWLRGERPLLSDLVQNAAPEIRSPLFTELLGIELEFRTQVGEVPGQEEYESRYQDFTAEIQTLFRKGLRAQGEERLKTSHETSQFPETPEVATDSAITRTMLADAFDTVEDFGDEDASGEVEFRKYLTPSTRTGWLGRLGHYEIEAILGRGAFGIVAKALDEKLHRVVAIKLMNPDLAATSPPRHRFLREARTAAAVSHENIVAIYAVEEAPIPYLVMEYIPGQTLQQRMDERGPLEAKDVLRIGQQVAAGLAAAHSARLIHRDIKPSNILLTGGPAERAKISDFGMARAVDDASMTQSGMIAGTPLYMAPEQALGEVLDPRADLFSLGSVLYQMASGRPPFRAVNTMAVLKRVCHDTPRPLNDVLPGIPGWLETIIFKLLEKKRDDRYQTAQELADLLARCQRELELNGKVTCVEVRPCAEDSQVLPSARETDLSAQRKPIGWLIGGVLAVAAVIGFALTNGGKRTPDSFTPVPSIATKSLSPTEAPTGKPPQTIGWQGWPAAAPAPAIAPFDITAAKKHQEAWAAYLEVPAEYTNSIGMKFRLIPPGEFLMGSTPEEIAAAVKSVPTEDTHWQMAIKSEAPQHKVILTQPLYLGATEVTQAEYEKVMGVNPSHFAPSGAGQEPIAGMKTASYPVEMVSWNDAVEFCVKLSQREDLKPLYIRAGETFKPVDGTGYRLPTEAEWESACRAGTTSAYWIGDKNDDLVSAGWFEANSLSRTHAVGELKANPYGLFDMHGNVFEWVQDIWHATSYHPFHEQAAMNPTSPFIAETSPFSLGARRVVRGGSWYHPWSAGRSSDRNVPAKTQSRVGFRVSLVVESVKQQLAQKAATTPSPAVAPFEARQARDHQEAWAKHLGVPVETTNSVGAKMILIPPGEFLMGAPDSDTDASPHEKPQHRVRLTKPFAIGATEITNRQFRQFVEATKYVTQAESDNQGAFDLDALVRGPLLTWNKQRNDETPVRCVSWEDARRFCDWLTQMEGRMYRLPTEAEWEFACRAGTVTRYSFGNDFSDTPSPPGSSGSPLLSVAQRPANPFGLFDMHGNVNEICWDSGRTFTPAPVTDPLGSLSMNTPAAVRGGAVSSRPARLRSSHRYLTDARQFPERDFATILKGFRVVAECGSPSFGQSPLVSADYEWSQPVNLGAGVNSESVEDHPTVTADDLTLIFVKHPDQENAQLWQCTRENIAQPFGAAVKLFEDTSSYNDYCPFLSHDGLTLWFHSTQPIAPDRGDQNIWVTHRRSLSEPFEKPQPLGPEINTSDVEGNTFVSEDGLTLLFTRGNPPDIPEQIFQATRKSASDEFSDVHALDVGFPGTWNGFPRLSADGRVLLFGAKLSLQQLWFATRDSVDGKFGRAQLVDGTFNVDGISAPFLSADERTLYFSMSRTDGTGRRDLWSSTRVLKGARPTEPLMSNLTPPMSDLTPPESDASPPEDIELGVTALGPKIAADGLSLWFHASDDRDTGDGRLILWQSWRQATNEPFGALVRVEDSINNQPDHNLSDVTFSADGLVLSFCRTKIEAGSNSDLWISTRPSGGASWSEPISVGPGVNSDHGEWEPELSPNGLELFFHSNRTNGFGGTDLWVSRRANREAEFGPAENLGPAINSKDIEGGAALSGDGLTLLFHRFTPNGVSLWRATRKSLDAAFEAPQHVTIPIPADEQFISVSLSASGDELYGMHRSKDRIAIAISRLKPVVAVAAEKNFALRVSPGVHVEMPTLNLDPAAPHTLEAWITPAITVQDNKHVVGWPGPSGLFVRHDDSSWTFGLAHPDKYQFVHDSQSITPGRRVHVATVRTGQEFRLFVDGQRVASDREHESPLEDQSTPFSLSLASAKAAFSGDYDEVRVSGVARYDENFTPATRFEPDADTLALYHCDENGGEQLLDASGNNHHGHIIGPAMWIDAAISQEEIAQ